MLSPQVLRVVLVVLSVGTLVVKGLLSGHFDVNQIVDLIAAFAAGAVGVKSAGIVPAKPAPAPEGDSQ